MPWIKHLTFVKVKDCFSTQEIQDCENTELKRQPTVIISLWRCLVEHSQTVSETLVSWSSQNWLSPFANLQVSIWCYLLWAFTFSVVRWWPCWCQWNPEFRVKFTKVICVIHATFHTRLKMFFLFPNWVLYNFIFPRKGPIECSTDTVQHSTAQYSTVVNWS